MSDTSKGRIDGELDGEMHLKVLMMFLGTPGSIIIPEYKHSTYLKRCISIFWWDLATTHYAGITVNLLDEAEVPMNPQKSLSGGLSRIPGVPNQKVCHGYWILLPDQILQVPVVIYVEKINISLQ